MQKIINVFIVLILLAGGVYLTMKVEKNPSNDVVVDEMETYSEAEIGLEFDYKIGEKGYVIDERMPVDLGTGLERVIMLIRTEDLLNEPPVGGEGPAVIAIAVFENPKKQSSIMWAEENEMYSSINLKLGEVAEDVVGGANAVRYMADGLYASQFVVIAHGENIYVVNGQFIDQDSDIHRDFEPLLRSIRFIPKPGQE